MNTQDTDQRNADQENPGQGDVEQTGGDEGDIQRYKSGQIAEKPEPSDEQKEKAAQTAKSYVEERPTTVLPGSDSTVTGTAVNDWIDDEGNPVHGDVAENRQEAADRDHERNKRAQKQEGDSE